jgi:hypothetical protein
VAQAKSLGLNDSECRLMMGEDLILPMLVDKLILSSLIGQGNKIKPKGDHALYNLEKIINIPWFGDEAVALGLVTF